MAGSIRYNLYKKSTVVQESNPQLNQALCPTLSCLMKVLGSFHGLACMPNLMEEMLRQLLAMTTGKFWQQRLTLLAYRIL